MTETPRPETEPERVSYALPERIRRRIESGDLQLAQSYPPGSELDEERADRQRTALESRLRMYRVPGRFEDARIADLTPEQNPDGKVTRWWAEGGQTLILRSEVKGNGKSHAMYALGNELVRDPGVWAVTWKMLSLNDAIRPGHDQTAYDVACEATLLLLDDLGGERMSEWTLERLHGLIDQRWSNNLRTVVTTNLSGQDLYDRYGERIVDRLIDGSWVAAFTGPSRRSPLPW